MKINKKKIKTLLTSVSTFLLLGMPVYATEPQFISGTRNLINDLTRYLMGFVAIVTALLLIISLYQWNIASDEEKPKYKKKAFWTVVIGVGILVSSSVVTWVFNYYGG